MAEVLYTKDGKAVSDANPLPVKMEGGGGGSNGKSLEFDWDGTELGIRQEGDEEYEYTDLKGDPGEDGADGGKGDPGDEGPKGDPGSDGVGVEAITYDDEEGELVFEMSDGSENRVPFPSID